jgi:hypothetical protein
MGRSTLQLNPVVSSNQIVPVAVWRRVWPDTGKSRADVEKSLAQINGPWGRRYQGVAQSSASVREIALCTDCSVEAVHGQSVLEKMSKSSWSYSQLGRPPRELLGRGFVMKE